MNAPPDNNCPIKTGHAADNGHWHLDKRFSWGHIITTLGMLSAAFLWFTSLDNRVGLVESDIEYLRQHDLRHEAQATEQWTKLDNRIEVQTKRLEGRMEAQYNEIIRRLELLNSWAMDNQGEEKRNRK